MIGGATGSEIEAELRAGRAIAQGAARAAARSRGTAGGWLERMLGQATQPVQNWRTQLWDIMNSTAPIDWSMRRCNKTYACAGGLVGTVSSPGMGMGVVAFDTSGSMTDDVLAQPVAEANAIIQQCAPEKLYVLSVDAHVANAQEVTDVFVPELKGGGGTSFVPAFDWVSERVTEDVGFLLYFTDGYGDWESVTPPPYPVIWFIVAGGTKEDPPFGRVIRMME
jgi:predicted metal-dependent peptidase